VAARLASIGFEANAAALEGHKGFFQAYGPTFDVKRISGRLGSPFSILDPGSSVKPHPCGVVGQVVMDSMRDLLIMNPFRPEDVRRIRVTTSFFYHNYPSGTGLVRGAVMGRIAGAEAVAYARSLATALGGAEKRADGKGHRCAWSSYPKQGEV
jgi:hypothetical protein